MSAGRWSGLVRGLGGALPFGVGVALAVVGALQLNVQGRTAARVDVVRARLAAGLDAERALGALDAAWRAALVRPDGDARQAYAWHLERVRDALSGLRSACEAEAVREALASADELVARWHASVVEPSFEADERRRKAGSAREGLESLVASDLPALLRERTRARLAALQGAFRWNDRAHAATLALERDLEARESAQRAFLLDGSGEQLGRLAAAEAALREHVAELRRIAPQETAAIDEVAELVDRWSQEVSAPQIEARRALPSVETTRPFEVALARSPLLEAARAALQSALEAEQEAGRRLESELWSAALHGQRWALAALGAVAALGGIVAVLLARRSRLAAPAATVGTLARIDRSLERIARRQDELGGARELDATPALPVPSRAAVAARAPGSARGQIEDVLVWLACRQDTLFLALYTLHGPTDSLSCELAVGWKGHRLPASQFSPRGLHDGVLCTGSKIFVEGPFDLAGEFLGMEGSAAVAQCVVGWPVTAGERRMGVLLAAHREPPRPEADALTGAALEWIAELWTSARGTPPVRRPAGESGANAPARQIC
jgi:CHASE3 domain sensor protein